MPVSAEVSRLVNEIRDDRSHGAIELARQALVVLKTAAKRSLAADVDRFLHEQRGVVQALALSRPSMAPVGNAASRLLEAVEEQAGQCDVKSLREFTAAKADETITDSLSAVAKIARNVLELIADGAVVMTHSYSSTVVAALHEASSARKDVRVLATRSGPGGVGQQTARQLAGFGIPVTLVEDAAVALHVSSASVVLLGADTVCVDGVVNGIGSYQLALLSDVAGVPVYVLCDTLKFAPELIGRDVDLEDTEPPQVEDPAGLPPGSVVSSPRFDLTSLELITAIVTETGVLLPSDVATHLLELRDG